MDVLIADMRLDTYLFQTLERHNKEIVFTRLDAEIGDHLLDKEKEKNILDAEGKTEAGRLADFYRCHINGEEWEVEAKSLASKELPAMIILNEQERRMRDHFRAMDSEGVFGKHLKRKIVLNTNNPLIHQISQTKDSELAKELVCEVVDISLLAQKEIDAHSLHDFVKRTARILEKLTASR
jgi:molecular chaperone HtpG